MHTTRAWVEIDLGALRRNAAAIARRSGARLLPMVKADAYGLGSVPVVRALETLDPWGFGVATIDEGIVLREAGITRPIVIFTPLLPPDLVHARQHHLTPTLGDAERIRAWGALLDADPGSESRAAAWHLAIETGMSRAGVPWERVGELAALLRRWPPEGAFTHFHSAERNDGSMAEQERRFEQALRALPARPSLLHTDNSAAVARRREPWWDLVRPGVFLYGVGSGPGAGIVPEPVAAVRARIVELRELAPGETVSYDASYRAIGRRRIATVALGYADGYRRALSNRGTALLRGRPVSVAGLVTMDMTMLDVTDVPAAVGDIVTFLGADGAARLDAESVARTADMSPYELLTGLRGRLPRHYVDATDDAEGPASTTATRGRRTRPRPDQGERPARRGTR